MQEKIPAFLDSVAAAFALKGPLCVFGFPRRADPTDADWPGGSGLAAGCIRIKPRELESHRRLPLADGAAGTVLCLGALPYLYRPHRAVAEMLRILRPGGAVLVCVPGADSEAEQPPAFWHPTPRSVERLLADTAASVVGWQGADAFPHTVYGIGFKPPLPGDVLRGTGRFLEGFQRRLTAADADGGRLRRWKDLVAAWLRGGTAGRRRRDCHRIQFAVHLSVDRHSEHDPPQGCLPDDKTGTRLDIAE